MGRIAATVDRLQDEVHGDRTGLFGWFETEDSEETARALVDAAEGWLREHGRDRLRGPLSYTTNGISGLLVEDQRPGPPVIDMAYNPPWYERLLLACGLAPAKDLLAFWMEAPETPDERMARVTRRLLERGRFGLRTVRTDRRGFAEDVEHVLRIYNAAWERNWGFVPLTAEEIREQAQAFRPILVPELLLFAEHDGLPVGFSLALPDINRALHRIHGRLWPWSVVRLLRAKARIDVARMITLGVVPECRRMGLEAALIHGSFEKGAARGFRTGECSWVLGDNQAIIAPIEQVGGRVYRRYRLYEKAL